VVRRFPIAQLAEPFAMHVDPELRQVVTDLVALLNGKNILNDSEGMVFCESFPSNCLEAESTQ